MKTSIALFLCFLMVSCSGEVKMNTHTNKLINEKSPYLLQHAHNPVNWYPWGTEAFDKANKEDKPIFLSIGYSTCHWCHVMERESFEDDQVAKLLNDAFVCIKVDREERPDIDSIYMTVCQMLTGAGGWPLTIIMTPDKKPFYAATYIPKESRFGRIGLMELIPKIENAWKNDRANLLSSADKISNALQSASESKKGKLSSKILATAVSHLEKRFDPEYGGFGRSPKFPAAHQLIFLMRYHHYAKNAKALAMVEKTLIQMSTGGIFDQLGYGFHRYSTDRKWFLPHFEKMLYDQAMLASAYLDAYQITINDYYAEIANEIFAYVAEVMTSPEGAFYSAQDADSDGEEGKYYVWSEDELKNLLTPREVEFMKKVFHVTPEGNFKDEASGANTGQNILYLTTPLTKSNRAEFDSIRKKLLPIRKQRIHPLKDTKALTDWNSLMIAAFAKGARILNSTNYRKHAVAAMDFLLKNMLTKNGELMHRYREGDVAIKGKLDDYAFMIYALIELYETTFDPKYLTKAKNLSDYTIKHFKDAANGGFFLTADDDEKLISRPKEAYDGAIPSGNSVMAMNLVKLSKLTGDASYEKEAESLIDSFAGMVSHSPESFAQMLSAFQLGNNKSREILIAGEPEEENTKKIINRINETYMPDTVVILKTQQNAAKLAKVAEFTAEYKTEPGKTTVFICSGGSCDLPLSNVKQIFEKLNIEKESKIRLKNK